MQKSFPLIQTSLERVSGHFLHELNRPGQIARPMPIGRARVRKTSETRPKIRKFCLAKKKKSLDLYIYSQIDETMKKF